MTEVPALSKIYVGIHRRTMNPQDIDDTWFWGDPTEDFRNDFIRFDHNTFKRHILYECESEEELVYIGSIFKTFHKSKSPEIFKQAMKDYGLID